MFTNVAQAFGHFVQTGEYRPRQGAEQGANNHDCNGDVKVRPLLVPKIDQHDKIGREVRAVNREHPQNRPHVQPVPAKTVAEQASAT